MTLLDCNTGTLICRMRARCAENVVVRESSPAFRHAVAAMGLPRLFKRTPAQPSDKNRVLHLLYEEETAQTPLTIAGSCGLSVERTDDALHILHEMGLVSREESSFSYQLTEHGQRIARRGR